jgi:hypothetical protein
MNVLKNRNRFNKFLIFINEYVYSYFCSIGRKEDAFPIFAEWGYRYIKLEAIKNDGKETWGFVDIRNGDCLKAASYKSPSEKTPRGNIFDNEYGMSHVTWSGFEDIENKSGWPWGLRLETIRGGKKKKNAKSKSS